MAGELRGNHYANHHALAQSTTTRLDVKSLIDLHYRFNRQPVAAAAWSSSTAALTLTCFTHRPERPATFYYCYSRRSAGLSVGTGGTLPESVRMKKIALRSSTLG